jgi:hypothetical protein
MDLSSFLDGYPPYAYVLAFVAIWMAGWVTLSILFSAFSGWTEVARSYRADHTAQGQRFLFQSARMKNFAGFRGSLIITVSEAGLYLSVLPLFRIGMPSLFIPWADVSAVHKRLWFGPMVEYRFRKCPQVPFAIARRLADRISAATRNAPALTAAR